VPPRDRGGEVLRSDDEADRHERLGERRRQQDRVPNVLGDALGL